MYLNNVPVYFFCETKVDNVAHGLMRYLFKRSDLGSVIPAFGRSDGTTMFWDRSKVEVREELPCALSFTLH